MRKIKVYVVLFLLFSSFSLSGQEIKDRPKEGEGIYAFLKRHNRLTREDYKAFIKLNKNKLGKNNELKKHHTYIIPSIGETNVDEKESSQNTVWKEPLFGKKEERVELLNNQLKGACFYIVSGHGGPDPGAIGKMDKYQLHEDEYAYDIALRLAKNLMQQGAKVYLIIQDAKDGIRNERYLSNSKRETCMGEKIPLSQIGRLKQRSDKINRLYEKDKPKYNYCRSVFIHLDSRSYHKQLDVFFYHAPKSKLGERLANEMKRTFASKYDTHQPSRGFTGTVSSRSLYVLTKTQPVGLFVELGNIQNQFDQRRFVLSSNRQALANWLALGLLNDFKQGR
ncbi:MAG: N-acetylmuramoyl-L-alanine amidase [Bacteroidales bacterium]|nr:N-acetylmuramoyl-L-alanine amidase [Bacteroidales bacterium]